MDEISVGQRVALRIDARERREGKNKVTLTGKELSLLMGPIDAQEAKAWRQAGIKNRWEAMKRRGLVPEDAPTPGLD